MPARMHIETYLLVVAFQLPAVIVGFLVSMWLARRLQRHFAPRPAFVVMAFGTAAVAAPALQRWMTSSLHMRADWLPSVAGMLAGPLAVALLMELAPPTRKEPDRAYGNG